uniref:Large ribosomal subunit protein uL24m n=2 Tax=Plectus sambesii TaxID=2011161 RepID=A0A914XKP4_9BILA
MTTLTKVLLRASNKYTELGYNRHMPKSYVERVTQAVPRRVYDNRFGAPAITRWRLHPDDVEHGEFRPWEQKAVNNTLTKVRDYHKHKLMQKYHQRGLPQQRIPDELWTMLKGDLVQVMIGKDKGKKGKIAYIVKERNWVFVEGLHMKRTISDDLERMKKMGVQQFPSLREQPLDVAKGEVMLVDPKDEQPCEAEWVLNEDQSDYIRVSKESGVEIPIPSIAFQTYEYNDPKTYREVELKDTSVELTLERTYKPSLSTFEEDISKEQGIDERRTLKPTYWY